MMLALHAPALLTHEEQLVWKVVRECGAFWFGRFSGIGGRWTWDLKEESLQFDNVRQYWDAIKSVAFGEGSEDQLPSWMRREEKALERKPAAFDTDLDDDVPF
jgi:hypothetical protein